MNKELAHRLDEFPLRSSVRIPLHATATTGNELTNIAEAIAHGSLTGDGKFSKLCEKWLEDNLKTKRAMLVPSCTSALEMSALLLGVGPGDEVIMPSFTFVSTANAFVLRGATPVFVDIHEDTLNINEASFVAAITKKTKAVVPVHYAGTPCNMEKIVAIARDNQISVVEDAAQGLLSRYHGRYAGTMGRFGCISFHATKNVTSGHGGAILLNDETDVVRAEVVRDRGTNRSQFLNGDVQKYSWIDLGSSFFLSEICSAYLFEQLQQAESISARRSEICAAYNQGLGMLAARELVKLPAYEQGIFGNGHIFFLLTKDAATRGALLAYLNERGVAATFHYTPLHSSPAGQRFCRAHGDLSVTSRVSETLVRLPVFATMHDEEVQKVIELVRKFYMR